MTDRQFSIFMGFNLFKQAEIWLLGIDGMKHTQKQKLNLAKTHCKNFFADLEIDLEKTGNLEQFYDDGEYFSRVLEIIQKAKTVEEKQQLMLIMRSFVKGDLKIIHDEPELLRNDKQ